MNDRRHRALARLLITACGTLEEAAEACGLSPQRLSEFQNPPRPRRARADGGDPPPDRQPCMPADVIFKLEEYAGEPIYSRALFEARPWKDAVEDLLTEACEVNEDAGELQRTVRLATRYGKPTPAAQREIDASADKLDRQLEQLRAAGERASS